VRYADSPALQAAYDQIASLYETEDRPEEAMALAAELLERGEERSWAPVWWAYGAIHHELTDEAYARALELLSHVDASPAARAAALMLQAEIESTSAIEHGGEPDPQRQAELLRAATELEPEWPALRLRLAQALHRTDPAAAREQARVAAAKLQRPATGDPFESAISGQALHRPYVDEQLRELDR
jgi:hypothetical protein